MILSFGRDSEGHRIQTHFGWHFIRQNCISKASESHYSDICKHSSVDKRLITGEVHRLLCMHHSIHSGVIADAHIKSRRYSNICIRQPKFVEQSASFAKQHAHSHEACLHLQCGKKNNSRPKRPWKFSNIFEFFLQNQCDPWHYIAVVVRSHLCVLHASLMRTEPRSCGLGRNVSCVHWLAYWERALALGLIHPHALVMQLCTLL